MNVEKEGCNATNSIVDGQVHVESQEDIVENSGVSHVQSDLRMSDSCGINQDNIPQQENFRHGDSAVSFLRGSLMKLDSYFKSHSKFPTVVVIIVAAIFLLMQAHEYRSNSGACAAFLADYDTTSSENVIYFNVEYNLPPWSIRILPDCKNERFNTAKVIHGPDLTYHTISHEETFPEKFLLLLS